ncbi:hypothetical protein GMORB2_7774 [Geosmithia morbida]|uniref:Uncharacterized protein n=1 Tax=Geosmithia morbida TaxID=1094350 RepID=A0A9P4YS93_9HYPO|nr:uncharacterized protein GMORB2_7774 [Geosmithia morbida]KAF4122181.1 hypothetical protein GMORB2_7774 [Geosmithia morbida]
MQSSAAGPSAPLPASPARQNPRPLPPPAPEGDDEFNPFAGRTLRRSPRTGVNIPLPPEPELPPSANDPVSSTPPRGIHTSSSPSRRKSRNRPGTTMAGSPLKQPPSYPGPDPEPTEETNATPRKLFGGAAPSKAQPPPSRLSGAILAETTDNVRRLPARSTDTVRMRERDALRQELAQLRRDLDVTTRQNERIRAIQTSGRRVGLTDEDEVADIIRRHLSTDGDDASQPTQQSSRLLAKAALDPMAIVGFGKATATSAVPTDTDGIDISDIKSHHPVIMTAEEELPFLQLFTPFDITPSLTTLPRARDQPLRQLFSIQLRSRHCPGLFSARVDVVVDAIKMSIQKLDVAALEPAARPELAAFLDRICNGTDCNRSMQRNVGIVAWAMAEWLRVAERRARFWAQLRQDTRSTKRLLDLGRTVRARRPAKRTRDGDSVDREGSNAAESSSTGPVSRQDLLHFMDHQSFDLEIPAAHGQADPSSLRLTWTITFDWTGEAQSKVAVMVGVPGKWHRADTRGAFGRLPSLFENLVEGGEEPSVAVRKVIALLVGE